MAPTIAGLTDYTQAEDKLVASLASSTTLRTWFGAADTDAAKLRIRCHVSPETTIDGEGEQAAWQDQYPRVKVSMPDDASPIDIQHDATGGTFEFIAQSVRFEIEFLDLVDVKTLTEDLFRSYLDVCLKSIKESLMTNTDQGRFFASLISPMGAARVYAIDNVEGSLLGWKWSVQALIE